MNRSLLVGVLEAEGLLSEGRGRRRWSVCVHPFNVSAHHEKFLKFYNKIRKSQYKFFNYFRMSLSSFDELLSVVRPFIKKETTNFKIPVSPEARLTITLRFLSTGLTFSGLQYEFYLHKATIRGIVRECCKAIWTCLKSTEMPAPSTEMWLNIADTFDKKHNFPNCVGAVDGKHIRCQKPKHSGTIHFNYRKFYSTVLMAVVDANLKFIAINVGAYGKEGDSTVFSYSNFGKLLYSNSLNLPPPRCLPNTSENPQPFVFVGDEAFAIHTNLLRPYPRRILDAAKRVFNYRLSRGRRVVECAFGLLANKWRVFHTPMLVEPSFVDTIIHCCCVLHNFVRQRDGVNYEEAETYPFQDETNFGTGPRQRGLEVRDNFAEYFMGPGAVPFQNHYIY